MKTLFLNPPASGRQGYPVELARAAAMTSMSCLLDAAADELSVDETLHVAADYDLIVMRAEGAPLQSILSIAELFKLQNPAVVIGMIGGAAAANAERLFALCRDVDFVACEAGEQVCAEVATGRRPSDVAGLWHRTAGGTVRRTPPRPQAAALDVWPPLAPVFRQHLVPTHYRTSFLHHPYVPVSLGADGRERSVAAILDEVRWIREHMTEIREVFLSEGDFAQDASRAADLSRGLGRLGMAWACNVGVQVPYETLRVMRANGLRLVTVNYDSGSNLILHASRNGRRTEAAERFAVACRRLRIRVHGAFVLGLPGETHATLRQTIDFAIRVNPHTIHVSIADPKAQEGSSGACVGGRSALPRNVLHAAAADCYQRFYCRPAKFLEIGAEMLSSWQMARRRLRDAREFYRYLRLQPRSVVNSDVDYRAS